VSRDTSKGINLYNPRLIINEPEQDYCWSSRWSFWHNISDSRNVAYYDLALPAHITQVRDAAADETYWWKVQEGSNFEEELRLHLEQNFWYLG
jgi:hypothetical protein